MTNRCPIHDKPLVTTHGGSEICIPCYFAKQREHRKAVASWTNPKHNHANKARADGKRRAAGVRVGRGRVRREACKSRNFHLQQAENP